MCPDVTASRAPPHEHPRGRPDHARCHGIHRDRDAAGAPTRARRAAASATGTARPACSASSRRASPSCSASSSSWRSSRTTRRAPVRRPRPSPSRSRCRRRSSCRPTCARSSRASSSATRGPSSASSGPRCRTGRSATPSTRGAPRCSRPSTRSSRRPTSSSRRTTGGWTRPSNREQARIDRVHGAEGLIPLPLWLVLFVISAVIFVFILFFADSAEGVVTQGLLMGSVTVVITLLLLLLAFFDHPARGPGGQAAAGGDGAHGAHRRRTARRGRSRGHTAVRRHRPRRLTYRRTPRTGAAVSGSSGQACLGYRPRSSARTAR